MVRARRVKGHKRHIITDTQGNLVHAIVHTADIHDRDEAPLLLQEIVNSFPWLRHVFAWRLYWQQTQRRTTQDRHMDYRDHRAFGYCQRLRRPPSPKGGRAHTGVAQPQPPPRQGLRSNHRPGNRVVICLVNPIVFTTHRKTMNLRQIGLNQTLRHMSTRGFAPVSPVHAFPKKETRPVKERVSFWQDWPTASRETSQIKSLHNAN